VSPWVEQTLPASAVAPITTTHHTTVGRGSRRLGGTTRDFALIPAPSVRAGDI
jgi:hypothetical protein